MSSSSMRLAASSSVWLSPMHSQPACMASRTVLAGLTAIAIPPRLVVPRRYTRRANQASTRPARRRTQPKRPTGSSRSGAGPSKSPGHVRRRLRAFVTMDAAWLDRGLRRGAVVCGLIVCGRTPHPAPGADPVLACHWSPGDTGPRRHGARTVGERYAVSSTGPTRRKPPASRSGTPMASGALRRADRDGWLRSIAVLPLAEAIHLHLHSVEGGCVALVCGGLRQFR
jgi:hypothetical protein